MKAFFFISIFITFIGCAGNDTNPAQKSPPENLSSNAANKNAGENKSQKPSAQNLPPRKNPKWIPGSYKGLQLGKSTEKDVRRIFGKPKEIARAEDEYDNPIESKLDYIYDNEPQIIIDKKSKIVIEIWGGDFSTFEEAKEKYGDDFYEVAFTKKGCVFKEYEEKPDRKFPLDIAYPQKGFYFYLNEKYEVTQIYYVAKCDE